MIINHLRKRTCDGCKSTSFYNVSFNNDSVAVIFALTTQNNTATFSGARLGVATNMNLIAAIGQLIVNVYTTTGQLFTQTQLKGQTQYALRLPTQVPAGPALVVVVRASSQSSSSTFTLLVR